MMDDERTTEYMKHTERELFRVFHVFRGRQQAAFLMIPGDLWNSGFNFQVLFPPAGGRALGS